MTSRRAALRLAPPLLASALLAPPMLARAEGEKLPLAPAYFSAGDARFLQPVFDDIKFLGVESAQVGQLGSVPALRVTYDPNKVSYKRIVGTFWRACDPTSKDQFGDPGPTIVWAGDADRAVAERSLFLLQKSTEYNIDPTNPPMYKGRPILTEVRPLVEADWALGPDADQDWYTKEEKAYEKARKKTGRTKWFEDAFKPVTVTACQKTQGEGTVCGFVYFPCGDGNGCSGGSSSNSPHAGSLSDSSGEAEGEDEEAGGMRSTDVSRVEVRGRGGGRVRTNGRVEFIWPSARLVRHAKPGGRGRAHVSLSARPGVVYRA